MTLPFISKFFFQLTYEDYTIYRHKNKGPLSQKSYEFWKKNGGKDREGFVWKGKGVKKNKKSKNGIKSVQQTFKKGALSMCITYK